MKYIISEEIFEKYPQLKIGVVTGRGLNIKEKDEKLENLKKENIKLFLNRMSGKELAQEPNILAWRETYKSFGVKPKRHSPTAEALLKRVIKGDVFPVVNTAVDSYLAVELLTLLPIGGYDLSKVEGDITLRLSYGEEKFLPIGASQEEFTEKGEVVYSDNNNILTRRWNYRDADHSKITTDTKDIILISEAAYDTIQYEDLQNTVEKIAQYEKMFCEGTYDCFFLDSKNRYIEI